jgi:hypothetical protein
MLMRIKCDSFQCSILPDGKLRLDIESPDVECAGEAVPVVHDQVLHRNDVARLLGVHVSTVDRLASRRVNPLPLNKSLGKPFIFASDLHKYLSTNPDLLARYR